MKPGGPPADPLPDRAPDSEAAEVLAFWLGHGPYDARWAGERQSLWFSSDAAVDRIIAERFTGVVEAAVKEQRAAWLDTPVGWLAWLIAVDQFPRNLYRGSPRAFAHDPQAQRAALRGCASGFDTALPAATRLFCYLPFEHAEDRSMQARSLAAFGALHEAADAELATHTAGWLDYARRHAEPIERFGRFPHRNRVLGRTTTAEEARWLEAHPAGF
ncbi:DUF924 family protein [Pseudomarimonas salicorniae]|uniref:DUF924 domain-containing protein n=1 Tax=Pseudomarimonas salicorniae TaxID=2933270 RepID=A0ABT0GLF9_9GAMM|nr:DUF924 family protein [Lysobacter sp. CAU 1642]MCK7595385.1 DUF924 domain-containing protein [Lysobacter sp. CAU 1642]